MLPQEGTSMIKVYWNFSYYCHENWEEIFMEDNVNISINKFLNTYLRIFHFCFIKKRKNSNTVSTPWLTKGMKTSSFSSSSGPVSLCPGRTSALGLLCSPKHSVQHRFNNPVPLIKRQMSVTEAVLISFGSAISFPKTL
jgi:hypothetical protein